MYELLTRRIETTITTKKKRTTNVRVNERIKETHFIAPKKVCIFFH
jgi:hypothetical protein